MSTCLKGKTDYSISHFAELTPFKLCDCGTAINTSIRPEISSMPDGKKVPKPGPAKLSKNGFNDVDEWLKCAFKNQYLPEPVMKKLCEICKEYLMEGIFEKGKLGEPTLLELTGIRIQHSTCLYSRHCLRRPPWSILRCDRIISCSRWST